MTITPTAPSLYDLTYEQLAAQMAEWGEAGFRTKQIWAWLYQHPAALRLRHVRQTCEPDC